MKFNLNNVIKTQAYSSLTMNIREEKGRELFIELYDTHVDSIFRFCYFKTGNKETAQDLT